MTRPGEEPRDFGHLSRVVVPDPNMPHRRRCCPGGIYLHYSGSEPHSPTLPAFYGPVAMISYQPYLLAGYPPSPSIRRRLTRARNTFIMAFRVASYRQYAWEARGFSLEAAYGSQEGSRCRCY